MTRSRTKSGIRLRTLPVLAMFFSTALTSKAQTLNPAGIAFGNWVVQTTSTAKAILLANTQTVPLAISSISTSGDFAETSTCPIAPNTLAAGAKCQILVTFSPTVLGARAGTLTVNDNSSNSPQTAQLRGTGIPPVVLTPDSLAFGNQALNTTSGVKTVNITNNQTVSLGISGISTSGDFAQTSNCPFSPNTLAAHASCTVSVTFTPTTTGMRSGTLTVNDSALNSPQTASLGGSSVSPDPLGTANASNIACPSSSINGTCYAVAISCPNISDFTGYVKVTYPAGTPLGTVLFSNGGTGNGLYEEYTYGTTVLNTVLEGGLTLAQISWGGPFTTQQPYGLQTGPGGTRALACRYATLAQWIYTSIHLANTGAPFCATGTSSGGEAIGLGMAHYGLGSIFAMVEPTSGPPFARQDWACDCRQLPASNPCGVRGTFCVGLGDAQSFIDPAYSTPLCSQEVSNHSTSSDAIFYQDSVVAPDSAFAYPQTFVKFLYGALDLVSPNQGHTWASAITSSKAESCVADAGHSLPNYLDGAQQIASDILTYCKLPGGQAK
jgi:hypothetical protein